MIIAECLRKADVHSLLEIINQESNKELTCEVILKSMVDFNGGTRAGTVNLLVDTAMNDLEKYGNALKELVLYSWRNNLQGERFFKNPRKNEILYIDDDGELISFDGDLATMTQGDGKGMDYITRLGKYTVLTGPNTGKVFDGGVEAMQRNDPTSRPIQGPSMKK